jgi:6-phosphogluconate dehydrogenase
VWPRSRRSCGSSRVICMMVPATAVDRTFRDVAPLLDEGDIVVDGGNSHHADDQRRTRELAAKGVHYVDVGTSGGVWGGIRRGAERPPTSERRPERPTGGRGDGAARASSALPLRARPRGDRGRYGVAAASSPRGSSTSRRPALIADPGLGHYAGRGSDSGEGRWTIQAATDEGVPAPVLTTALAPASRLAANRTSRIASVPVSYTLLTLPTKRIV